MKLSKTTIEKKALVVLDKWGKYIKSNCSADALQLAISTINTLKNTIESVSSGESSHAKKAALALAILFRGLQNYIELDRLIHLSDDPTSEQIEKAWDKLWDCRYRVSYGASYYPNHLVSWVIDKLDETEAAFEKDFGTGLYASPEFLVGHVICSICGKDFRACDHLVGEIYDGVLCVKIPQDIKPVSVAIVNVPHDPRCRIWPWQLKGSTINGLCIMTEFRLDDFMEDGQRI